MSLIDTITVIHPSQKASVSNNPSLPEALNYMSTSMDILDWNMKRSKIKRLVGQEIFLRNYSYNIDAMGLCVKIMNNSRIRNKQHKPFTLENLQ